MVGHAQGAARGPLRRILIVQSGFSDPVRVSNMDNLLHFYCNKPLPDHVLAKMIHANHLFLITGVDPSYSWVCAQLITVESAISMITTD